jgi:enoyl-CoA hydratase
LERAKRYLFTGDEIPASEAARIGMILECVPDDELLDHTSALAQRMARLPLNQLQMMKLLTNDTAQQMYAPDRSRTLSCLMDGVARHTQEGLDFVTQSQAIGWREAVRKRDAPFGDYGARPHP